MNDRLADRERVSSSDADTPARHAPCRDDREALRACVAELEAELEQLRSDPDLVRLRGELAAAKGLLSRLVRAELISGGVQSEGAPGVITWYFRVRNAGGTTIRLLRGETNWCLDRARPGDTSIVRLLEVPVESEFGDRPELRPGQSSDEYKVKLDTSRPALRKGLDRLGLVLSGVRDDLRPLVRVSFESVDVEYADSIEEILD